MIITCNIYYFFWLYKMSQLLQDQERECFPEQPPSISPWLLVVLALFARDGDLGQRCSSTR